MIEKKGGEFECLYMRDKSSKEMNTKDAQYAKAKRRVNGIRLELVGQQIVFIIAENVELCVCSYKIPDLLRKEGDKIVANLIKENALYNYAGGKGHCKHGIVYTMRDKKGQMWAIDTYWDSRFSKGLTQDTKYYSIDKVAEELEFIMMIGDAIEISSGEFELYDSKDKLYIPVGGWHERFLVNKNAEKNTNKVIECITYKIDSIEREIKSLRHDNEKLQQWLCCVEMNPDIAQLYKNEKYECDVELTMERANRT